MQRSEHASTLRYMYISLRLNIFACFLTFRMFELYDYLRVSLHRLCQIREPVVIVVVVAAAVVLFILFL
jgi:hypothetical protein